MSEEKITPEFFLAMMEKLQKLEGQENEIRKSERARILAMAEQLSFYAVDLHALEKDEAKDMGLIISLNELKQKLGE